MKKIKLFTTLLVLTAISYSTSAQITFGPSQQNPFSLANITSVDPGTNSSTGDLVDIDNDGDLDMLTGGFNGNFYYFENTGTSITPIFAAVQMNPFSLLGLGVNFSSTTFADLDNDGDFDLLSGGQNSLYYFENTGSVSSPTFAAAQINPFSLTNVSIGNPDFIDLDNDGDFDLLCGSGSLGTFSYFENTGTSTTPSYAAVQTNPFSLTSVSASNPYFSDIDGDGDYDIIVGTTANNGDYYYFENTGTVSSPGFAAVQINPFSLVSILVGVSAPTLIDLDNDGDLDLLSGSFPGDFYYFENLTCTGATGTDTQTACDSLTWIDGITYTTSNTTATFTISGGAAFGCDSVVTLNLTITAIDTSITINNDTLISNQSGATYQWLDCIDFLPIGGNDTSQVFIPIIPGSYAVDVMLNGCSNISNCYFVSPVGISENAFGNNITIYPNPTTGLITIDLNEVKPNSNIAIYSVLGQKIINQKIVGTKVTIDLASYENGVYYIKIQNENNVITQRIIKQ